MKIFHKPFVLLLGIILIGAILRFTNLSDNILFSYDQARDAQRVYNMIYKGDIKIVGPETDIQGIFNGPLLYYLLAPIYWISNFDPNAAVVVFVIINLLVIPLVYFASKIFFRKDSIALVAALLWSISYEQGFFSRYISNASPMSITTFLFFFGLTLYLFKDKSWGLPISALGYGLAVHCNFYFIYLIIFYPIFFILFKKIPSFKSLLVSAILLTMLFSPWIITELKWGFIGTKSLFNYLFRETTENYDLLFKISSMIVRYIDRVSQAIYFSFFPHKYIGLIFVLAIMIKIVKSENKMPAIFLVIWTLSTFPLFFFKSGVHTVEVINSSIFAPLTIIVAYGIFAFSPFKIINIPIVSILILGVVVLHSLNQYISHNFIPVNVMTHAPSLLKDAKQIIDYTYKRASMKDFAICSISEPLFINTKWSFLYATYGKQKYGYVPHWTGQKQILNESFIPYAKRKMPIKFIIREPMFGIPDYAPIVTNYIEDTQNTLVEEIQFGAYSVQQRAFKVENGGNISKYSKEQIEKNEDVRRIEPRFSCDVIYPE